MCGVAGCNKPGIGSRNEIGLCIEHKLQEIYARQDALQRRDEALVWLRNNGAPEYIISMLREPFEGKINIPNHLSSS